LISAQRNFQANSKAIEAANTLSTTIVNMRT
ncbi:MAG TPA: flagellar basal body rod C-terminal domain-containing protein, partial [Sphingobium sp.]|nr:flagellar basal body rod C-terminal domain-containing protein [Sphingobium sp.]